MLDLFWEVLFLTHLLVPLLLLKDLDTFVLHFVSDYFNLSDSYTPAK